MKEIQIKTLISWHRYRCLLLLLFFLPVCISAQTRHCDSLQKAEIDPHGGANCHKNKGDNRYSSYYVNPDFYNSTSNDTLLILPHFCTMQQTTEWSCGNVSVLMALNYWGLPSGKTEWKLAESMHTMTDHRISGSKPGTARCYADYGTRLSEIYHYFKGMDSLRIVASSFREAYTKKELVKKGDIFPACDIGNLYPSFTSVDTFSVWLTSQIRAKRPVLVEWSDWDGHWVCIIGIDNNGTPDLPSDDILIFADPYDTSDHWQDGYSIAPLERFFYLWKDRAVAPKPYQLQPFIVIERCSKQSNP